MRTGSFNDTLSYICVRTGPQGDHTPPLNKEVTARNSQRPSGGTPRRTYDNTKHKFATILFLNNSTRLRCYWNNRLQKYALPPRDKGRANEKPSFLQKRPRNKEGPHFDIAIEKLERRNLYEAWAIILTWTAIYSTRNIARRRDVGMPGPARVSLSKWRSKTFEKLK